MNHWPLFGEKGRIDLKKMLDVINVLPGQNFATYHFPPNYGFTETYYSASQIAILRKEIKLFVDEDRKKDCKHIVAEAVSKQIKSLDETSPGVDQNMICFFFVMGECSFTHHK